MAEMLGLGGGLGQGGAELVFFFITSANRLPRRHNSLLHFPHYVGHHNMWEELEYSSG